jgi:Tfp pilus assembly protein PilF
LPRAGKIFPSAKHRRNKTFYFSPSSYLQHKQEACGKRNTQVQVSGPCPDFALHFKISRLAMTIPRTALFVFAILCCNLIALAQRPALDSSGMPHSPFGSALRDDCTVSGTVTDMNNKPLKDVRVELTNANGVAVNSTYTNVSGAFEFSHIAQGSYSVVATSGLQQTSEHVEASTFNSMVAIRMQTETPQDGVNGRAISVAQYKVPGKARDEYRKAQAALEKGKTEDAGKHLARSLEIDPNYADALTLRAVLALNQHNPESAIADLDKAVKADGNYAMAYMVMGSALNMQSKFDEALRALQRGESLAPNYWQAHFEMGKSFIGKGDYPSALSQLQRAQAMAPQEYALIYLLEAHALLAMKQYPEAMSALQAYLQKEPAGPNRQEAEKMLEKAQAFVSKNGR